MPTRPPAIDGVAASRVQLPQGAWATVLEALDALFPAVGRDAWEQRMVRGRVLGADGSIMQAGARHRVGMEVYYYREVAGEVAIDAPMHIVHDGGGLVVVDKPHGLPVVPSGRHVADTVLARLLRAGAPAGIAPLHRIDRDTAGLVMLSADPTTRARFQRLFESADIAKHYDALVTPPITGLPGVRHSRLVRGTPFPRMREAPGDANAETRIVVVERGSGAWHCALSPVTGRKHQLRVHMAALGAPILHDPLYPTTTDAPTSVATDAWTSGGRGEDAGRRDAEAKLRVPALPARPWLQLLAKRLSFTDPVTARTHRFESARMLDMALMSTADAAQSIDSARLSSRRP